MNVIRWIFGAILVATLCSTAGAEAAKFALRSRSLVEGPSRVAAIRGSTIVLGTGCSLAVFGGGRLGTPGVLDLEGEPADIEIEGTIAYVVSQGEGLVTVNIADPASPKRAGGFDDREARLCALAGGALVVADGRGRLSSYSLENPRSPRLAKSLSFTAMPASLCAEGDILAIVFPQRTEILRIGAGGTMKKVAEIPTTTPAKKGVLVDGVLCLLSLNGRVAAWDLGRPEKPLPMPSIDRRGIDDIAVGGHDGALLGESRYVMPFRIERPGSGPEAPARIRIGKAASISGAELRPAENSPEEGQASRAVSSLFVGPGSIGTIAPLDGVRLYARRRSALRETGFYPTRGFALGVVADRGLCYLANGHDGVRIGRVSEHGSVDWIGHLQTNEARDVKLAGSRLVVADGTGGLKVVDVSNPRAPRIIGSRTSPLYICGLAVREDLVYCAGGLGGAEIVDIANPRRPQLVWRRRFLEVRGIDVDGTNLYICDGDRGLRIFALGGPEPWELGVLDTPGWNCGVVARAPLAYLADGGKGIVVANLSDPARPRSIGSKAVGSIVRQVFIADKILFAAAYMRGIAAIDVSNPRRPVVTATYPAVNDGRGVFADGRFVYLASGSGGLYVLSYAR